MMAEHQDWQKRTAIQKIELEQRQDQAPPLAHSISAAARYVGAEAAEVERWWNGRGR